MSEDPGSAGTRTAPRPSRPSDPPPADQPPADQPPADPRPAQMRGLRAQVEERRRFRHAVLLLAITLVAPGSAQLADGNKRIGKIALGVYGGVVLTALLVAWRVPPGVVAGWFLRSWVLTLVLLLAVALGGGWIALFVDAWRLGRPPSLSRRHRLVAVAITVACCLMVSMPLTYAARYAQVARDDVLALFPQGDAAPATNGRLNVLLLGGDAADDRPGVRADSINVASIDVSTGRAVLFGLPRNLQRARFPHGTELQRRFPYGFRGDQAGDASFLLNAVYGYGRQHPDLFPGAADPGAEAMKQAVSGTLGVPVHYYVLVNLFGFRDLVDALGGVSVNVKSAVHYAVAGKPVTIEPGRQHLSGAQTLIYARSRTGTDDYSRMGRQRCVLGAILREADPGTVLLRFQSIATTAKGLMSTDIPQGTLPDMVALAAKVKDAPVRTVAFTPPLIVTSDPDIALIHQRVERALEPPPAASSAASPKASATGGSGAQGRSSRPATPQAITAGC